MYIVTKKACANRHVELSRAPPSPPSNRQKKNEAER